MFDCRLRAIFQSFNREFNMNFSLLGLKAVCSFLFFRFASGVVSAMSVEPQRIEIGSSLSSPTRSREQSYSIFSWSFSPHRYFAPFASSNFATSDHSLGWCFRTRATQNRGEWASIKSFPFKRRASVSILQFAFAPYCMSNFTFSIQRDNLIKHASRPS
jgi:hypothetical protein